MPADLLSKQATVLPSSASAPAAVLPCRGSDRSYDRCPCARGQARQLPALGGQLQLVVEVPGVLHLGSALVAR